MVCAAVFETVENRRKELRDLIVGCLIRSGRDMDVLWFSESVSDEKMKLYGKRIHLAFISLNDPHAEETGHSLYRQNPECRICYYSDRPVKLEPLLSSRPIAYYLWSNRQNEFSSRFDMLINEVMTANDIFCHETKRNIYLIPYSNIMYLQSSLKYVLIHRNQNEEEDIKVLAKLSEIEEKLDGRFVRIHKSYIVNRAFVKSLDKTTHLAVLTDGEMLPVSDRWYESAAKALKTGG